MLCTLDKETKEQMMICVVLLQELLQKLHGFSHDKPFEYISEGFMNLLMVTTPLITNILGKAELLVEAAVQDFS